MAAGADIFRVMKNTLMILGFWMLASCASYNDAIEGRWDLVRIKNEYGEQICEIGKDEHCDVIELTFERKGEDLVVTGCDENGAEIKTSYSIKDDGRLVSKSIEQPNMYILDIKTNEIVLIDLLYDPVRKRNMERLLVFEKHEDQK